MAIKFQFNKISLQYLRSQLKIRVSALPTLKSKESALRLTVKRQKEELDALEERFEKKIKDMESAMRLWGEFSEEIFALKEVILGIKKVAGIKMPQLEKINYQLSEYSRFIMPAWISKGIEILKEVTTLIVEIKVAEKDLEILEYARKKTTQKVNLYEKVQIPQFSEAILKIKRYLEDVENLDKAAQKITKQKQHAAEGGVV